VWLSFLCEIY